MFEICSSSTESTHSFGLWEIPFGLPTVRHSWQPTKYSSRNQSICVPLMLHGRAKLSVLPAESADTAVLITWSNIRYSIYLLGYLI